MQTTCKPSLGWHSQAAIGAGVGGLAGAAGGAIVGAFLGNPGIGAAAGGFGGAAKQGFSAEDKFKGAYSNCMSGRGHNVLRS